MVSSLKKSSRSSSPESPSLLIMRSVSRAITSAWPRMNESRSDWLRRPCLRCSGVASKTTPRPKTGVMNG